MTDTYAYDGENRLVQLQKNIPGDNNITVGAYYYTYDYRTRRVLRTECTPGYETEWGYQPGVQTDTEVIYSGGTSVQEYNLHDMPEGWEGGGMMMMTQTVTLPNPLMPLRFRWSTPDVEYIRGSDYGGGIGGILYTLRWDEPSYTHNNRRGDIIAKTDGTGSLTYQATYEAYGKRTQESGYTQDRQKANSKDEDPTGLLNEGFRYRDLDTGTFITRDPLGFVDGPNMYAYVVCNPWTKFDPEGLEETDAGTAIIQSRQALMDAEDQAGEDTTQAREQTKNAQKSASVFAGMFKFAVGLHPAVGATEAITGKDSVTNEKLGGTQRTFAALSAVPVSAEISVVRGVETAAAGQLAKNGGLETAQTILTSTIETVSKVNLNNNSAVSSFGIYVIEIAGKIYKVGKADLERITQSSGLPTRLHQQLRKLREKFGKTNVEGEVAEKLGKTTTAEAKAAESAKIKKIVDETGKVPEGNARSYKP